jgi:predicted glutamine amidotransferase
MKRIFTSPIWYDNSKKSVICKITIVDDDGNEITHNGHIDQFSDAEEEQINPDWSELLNHYSIDDIDNLTDEFDKKQQEQLEKDLEIHEEEKKRHDERKKQEKLFSTKLEIFEVPEIKESQNRAMKSKIRKANNETEVFLNAIKLFLDETKDDESSESE